MQKVLIVTTYDPSLRADIEGWTFEDGDAMLRAAAKHDCPSLFALPVWKVNSNEGAGPSLPPTVLHALAAGWKLLAPPSEYETALSDRKYKTAYEWWLTKD